MAKAAAPPAMTKRDVATARQRPLWRFVPILIVLAGLALGSLLGWHRYLSLGYLGDSQQALQGLVANQPILAPLGFAICYTGAVAFSFPAASVLTVVGGFLFGWAFGALLSVLAATAGATLLFLAARTALAGTLRRRLHGFSARLAEGFERDAFTFLLVLRLAPFIPFVVVNIAPALFHVRLRTFFAATLIGIIPGALAYAWLGEGVGSVLEAAAAAGRHVGLKDLVTPEITIAFAALTLVGLVAAVVKSRWRRSVRMARR